MCRAVSKPDTLSTAQRQEKTSFTLKLWVYHIKPKTITGSGSVVIEILSFRQNKTFLLYIFGNLVTVINGKAISFFSLVNAIKNLRYCINIKHR